jgi:hypothetical protein
MIVILGDAFGLPPPLLRLCNCVDYRAFQSIIAQMVDLVQPLVWVRGVRARVPATVWRA